MSSLHITPRRAMILLAIRHHEHGLTFSQLSEIIPGSENQLEQHIEYLREHILLDVVPGKRLRDPSMRIIDMGRFVSDIVGSGFGDNYRPEPVVFHHEKLGESLNYFLPHYASFNNDPISTNTLIDYAIKREKHNITAYIHNTLISHNVIWKTPSDKTDQPTTYSLAQSIPPEYTKGPINNMIIKAMENRSTQFTMNDIMERIEQPLRACFEKMLTDAEDMRQIVRRICPNGEEGFSAFPSITCKGEK